MHRKPDPNQINARVAKLLPPEPAASGSDQLEDLLRVGAAQPDLAMDLLCELTVVLEGYTERGLGDLDVATVLALLAYEDAEEAWEMHSGDQGVASKRFIARTGNQIVTTLIGVFDRCDRCMSYVLTRALASVRVSAGRTAVLDAANRREGK